MKKSIFKVHSNPKGRMAKDISFRLKTWGIKGVRFMEVGWIGDDFVNDMVSVIYIPMDRKPRYKNRRKAA